MDNQHRQITGYRDLTQTEIDLINEAKALSLQVGDFLKKVEAEGADGRWLSIGRTQLQQGFMALTRSVAKPEGF